jgi:zinc transport system permease protein
VSLDLVFDRLFLLPFLNGLALALLLPLLGCYIRLREEWLAALGLAQVAAAGVVLGGIVLEPVLLVALAAAALAAAAKALVGRTGNDAYAVMILFGWSAALLAAANSVHGDDLSRALIQGQLYFTGMQHLEGLAGLVLLTAAILPWISRRLLVGRFFPDLFRANGLAKPHHDLVFDLLVAVTLAFAATAIGVFAAFALVFVPPWIAFRFAPGWKKTLVGSVAVAFVCYVAAFAAAIALDQPFGPVLVAVLLVASLGRLLRRHH